MSDPPAPPPATTYPTSFRWQTRFTARFPCTAPLLSAPMANVSGGKLASAACRAGALGFIAAGHLTSAASVSSLETEIDAFRKSAPEGSPLAVGFISHSTFRDRLGWERVEDILKRHKPEVVQFFAPAVTVRKDRSNANGSMNNVDLAHAFGCQVVAQVGTEEEAKVALDAGVDCIMAQGTEAGGHGVRPELGCGTLPLAARVVSLVRRRSDGGADDLPVLAAGGIVDGRGVAAALALGCDGAVLGTRLWASTEAMGRTECKDRLADPTTGPDQVLRTTVVDAIANTYSSTPWPEPYDSSGMLRNGTTDTWHGREGELGQALRKRDAEGGESGVATQYRADTGEYGDAKASTVFSGKGVGDIEDIESAYDIINRVNSEAAGIVRNLHEICPTR